MLQIGQGVSYRDHFDGFLTLIGRSMSHREHSEAIDLLRWPPVVARMSPRGKKRPVAGLLKSQLKTFFFFYEKRLGITLLSIERMSIFATWN